MASASLPVIPRQPAALPQYRPADAIDRYSDCRAT
jgi:hypothetical protein